MFYYLYEIKNNLNGKIYVGVHKTKDMNDGYMGSGKVIRNAILKHGITNFTKVILETFENAKDMYAKEKEVVNDEFLTRNDVYNLRRGGTGGFDYINSQGLAPHRGWTNTAREKAKVALSDVDWHQVHTLRFKKVDDNTRRNWSSKARETALSINSLKKRRETFKKNEHQQGEKNSQYGTLWVYHELIGAKKINKVLLPEMIEQGWRKGRK
jgi:hypothetical protein